MYKRVEKEIFIFNEFMSKQWKPESILTWILYVSYPWEIQDEQIVASAMLAMGED